MIAFGLVAVVAQADTIYFKLQDVDLSGGGQITGFFSWAYDIGDFENGTGQFIDLNIPWTSHDETDLEATFDLGNSVEITFPGNLHDDGVDITLFLVEALTPITSASIDLTRSKYDIGGKGFHQGDFLDGRIVLIPLVLEIVPSEQNTITLSWNPPDPAWIVQESPDLSPTSWTNSASGNTNPVTVPMETSKKFFRLQRQ